MAGLKLETCPERWSGYESRAPVPTDLRGCNQIALAGATFENPQQDLWREPIDRNKRVSDRPDTPRDLRESTFDAVDL